ncbi:type VI secretion protein [Burkholderia ubonensis]|uniref:type VI secretion system baseplate subunit TssF n=1 Tax=Burkholderia ubonensis TaxID=101571 RepID=UPI000751CCC6|nr:type VI secretion system baseplate subunit TssF [Burkholderia ubonensis]KVG74401.1 type VI secretion protein [Burkholderia ubonensis]KVH24985.1 type VI secretion protein [Burkholderia ubonensis]KVH51765.1 type VI secretion protein [Burkholderia ubonensis]KVH86064.1 type VI secretion protein [Burkholderia ubonensis]KVM32064.1 type VI secretion protein [Burkholderia ubonensis]
MDQLLPHYERELALLRRSIGTFATRYPKIAVRLGISGDHSEDPHIERMLQSFALLAADIGNRLDDNYPEFAEALLGMLYPQYLRTVPACAIAQFDVSDMFDKLTEPSVIARDTELASKVEDCRFRTVYDVTLAPVRISTARYASATAVPSDVVLPPRTTGLLSITFEVARPDFRIEDVPSPLRIHVNGAREVVGAVMDTMTMRTAAAFVENIDRRWSMLSTPPLTAVGYDGAEKLIDEDDGPPALRLLTEYFAFPKKFDFVDIDLAALARATDSSQQLTLHFAICGVHPESSTAQRLKNLSADHLKLFCTPIVNLFRLTSLPLKRNPITDTYPVQSQNTDAAGVEIWSVDAVRATTGGSRANIIHPFTSLMHGSSAKPAGPYWVLKQHNAASPSRKKETALSLVELDGRPATDTGIEQITADVSCSNGNLPRAMRAGAEDGDLVNEQGSMVSRIVMLDAPTEVARLSSEGDAAWRLITQLAPHSIELTRTGLVELKRLFRQFAAHSAGHANLLDGLTNLSHRVKQLWLPGEPMPSFVRGLEVTLTVDEQAFAAASLSTFIIAMDHFFAVHAPVTSFVQLVVMSANTGGEIRRCTPRPGTIMLA